MYNRPTCGWATPPSSPPFQTREAQGPGFQGFSARLTSRAWIRLYRLQSPPSNPSEALAWHKHPHFLGLPGPKAGLLRSGHGGCWGLGKQAMGMKEDTCDEHRVSHQVWSHNTVHWKLLQLCALILLEFKKKMKRMVRNI